MRLAPRHRVQPGSAPRAARHSPTAARRAPTAARRLSTLSKLLPPVLLLLTLVCLFPATRHAQPRPAASPPPARRPATLADYRTRLREAALQIEELAETNELAKKSEKPEVWSQEGFSSDFIVKLPETERAVFAKVRELFPQKERVEWGGSFIEVDNRWLHTELVEPKRPVDYYKQANALRALAVRLHSLEARVAEMDGGGDRDAAATDRDAERGRLNAILRGREFDREVQQEQGDALRRLVRRFIDWLLDLLPDGAQITPGASPRASTATQVVVLALCLGVLAYVARLLWLRRAGRGGSLKLKRGARVVLGERLEADQTAADLLDDAERLARSGDLRGAIRKAYVALLCELGDRGVVRLAQHKTNRDYLNAVRRAERPALYTEMLPLTFDFEVHWYGLRDASDADWESFKTRCRAALKGAGVKG